MKLKAKALNLSGTIDTDLKAGLAVPLRETPSQKGEKVASLSATNSKNDLKPYTDYPVEFPQSEKHSVLGGGFEVDSVSPISKNELGSTSNLGKVTIPLLESESQTFVLPSISAKQKLQLMAESTSLNRGNPNARE